MNKHYEEKPKKPEVHSVEKHAEEKHVEKPVEKPVEKSKEDNLKDTLVYLRDNVVHGSATHVERINKALGS